MKLSKTILQAMLVAATTGTIISCEKPKVQDMKKPVTENPKTTGTDNTTGCCPACGMG